MAATIQDITPTTAEVHALIPQRPDFTDTSKPSTADVESLIGQATASLWGEIGSVVTDPYVAKAKFVVSLNAASLVEESAYPEQQYGDIAPAPLLYQRFKDELGALRALLGIDINTSGSGAGSRSAVPSRLAYVVSLGG